MTQLRLLSWCLLASLTSAAALVAGQAAADTASPTVPAPALDSTDAALSEVRLTPSSCEQFESERRLQLEQQLAEADRRYWDELVSGKVWGDEIGDAYGYGGLGLSGIGEGGGGMGYGIGHGSAMGQGFRAAASSVPRFSTTNVQVQGVDEADIVKTDGRYLYMVANGALRIVQANPPKLLSVTPLSRHPTDLYLDGERAVIFASRGSVPKPACTYGYDCEFQGNGNAALIQLLDVSKREAPRLVREFEFSGSLLTSRRVGSLVHLAIVSANQEQEPQFEAGFPSEIPHCGIRESAVRAIVARLKRANAASAREASVSPLPRVTERGKSQTLCSAYYQSTLRPKGGYLSIVSFELHDDQAKLQAATIASGPGAVYATGEELYVAVPELKRGGRNKWYAHQSEVRELTELHRFSLGKSGAPPAYLGTGLVAGHVLNQFSMDEWQGHLRIATTTGRVPAPDVVSQVTVLKPDASGALREMGAVRGPCPG